MTTEEERGRASGDDRDRPGARISVGAADESVAKLQLAARWAELYAPANDDSMSAILRRFRHAYEYLDSITHGIEPHGHEE